MDRRTFLQATCLGSASLLLDGIVPISNCDVLSPAAPLIHVQGIADYKPSPLGMPGLFPGRVVELFEPTSIVHNRVSQLVVKRMLEQGMQELTGEKSAKAACRDLLNRTMWWESKSILRGRRPAVRHLRSFARS